LQHGKFSFLEVALKTIKSGTNALSSSISVLSSNCNKNNVQYFPSVVNGFDDKVHGLLREGHELYSENVKV
jgi:hypothetical protein